MRPIDLNGTWQLTFGPQGDTSATIPPPEWTTIPARVPGNVELDLLAAGQLPAPLEQGHRVYETQKYETWQWWYRRVFKGDGALFPRTEKGLRPVLVFDGLDCCATVILNGEVIGTADNMLIPHRFDLAEHLCLGENELLVRIDSPILAARGATPEPVALGMPVNWESLPIRKAPHMYGWDIMPRIVSAGIWRDVRIELLPPTHFRSVYWTTLDADPAGGRAEVLVDWDFAAEQRELDGWKVVVKLARLGREVALSQQPVFASHGRARFGVAGAALWWPRGMGEAALHDASLALVDTSGVVRAEHRSRIGLRTVRLERTDVTDEQGGEFVFRVNGEKLFAKGTNWVPLDALHSRDRQHLDAAVGMLADLNCNMVRCWGGNVYEDHPFFDRCDEQGILVWQDFALACAVYPQDQAFCDVIRREAEAIVARLRNHPSLALWAGNNEIDESYRWTGFDLDPNTDRLSREVLPEVVRRLDPARPYLPSSPYRSPELVRRGNHDHLKPEDHLWGPRTDFKGPFYVSSPAHFVSEIGYHGCPERASLEQMMDPLHVWPWQDDDQWLTHCVRPRRGATMYDYRIPLMSSQITVLFDALPTELEPYVLASQVVQAEALKFFIERWRSGKWRRTGMLWWNLRDGWPIISDAIVDYYNRNKLAYAYVRRLQADVAPMLGEPDDGTQTVWVANDTLAAADGTVTVRDADSGELLFDSVVHVAANESLAVGCVSAATAPSVRLLEWRGSGGVAANHYLAGPRPFRLADYARWLLKMGLDDTLAAVRYAAELA